MFQNESTLATTTIPDSIVGREVEVEQISDAVRPLAQNRLPDNLLVYGPPGVGKTTCVTHAFDQLEEQTGARGIVINCWQHKTHGALITQLLTELGDFTVRKGRAVDEQLRQFQNWLDRHGNVAVALDEFDQLNDAAEIVYNLQYAGANADNELAIVLIAEHLSSHRSLKPRNKSRLNYKPIQFQHYTAEDLAEILEQRVAQAFQQNTVSDHVITLIADIVAEANGDCRHALNMLLDAGRRAEKENSDTVTAKHVHQSPVAPSHVPTAV